MSPEEKRRRIVAAALSMTRYTWLEPCQYELMLLDEYVHGSMSIDKVIQELEEYNKFIQNSLAHCHISLIRHQ
jgi:hypothetical protein